MNSRKKRKIFKKILFLLIIFLITSILSIVLLIYGTKKEESESLFYNEQSYLDYKVCLKENDFYETDCLDKNMGYIANLIDYLNVEFQYNFKMNKKVDFVYKYYITAEVNVFEKNNPSVILFNKIINLLQEKTSDLNDSDEFTINEELKIDYSEYNELVRSYKNQYSVIADSTLKLTLHINVESQYNNFENPINTSNNMKVMIPLSESTVTINMDYKNINDSDVYQEVPKKTITSYIILISGVVFGLISVMLFIYIILFYDKKTNIKSEYEKLRDRLLKEYDYLITSSITLIEEGRYETYDVADFKELVQIAERKDKLIMWTEAKHGKELVSWFSIIDEEKLYRRIIKESDFDEKKK